ncbi:MAG: homocysteine S-methyltransferase family protein, partial [Candidatus Acidiferrales bacterium]
MKIEELNERLRDSVLIGDGAMGSMLYEMLGPQRCLDELNSTQAEAVFRVHQTYLEAGAQIIETNTFGANRHKLAALGLGDRAGEFNHRGVKIAREAREAARHEVLIAGSIGPLGTLRQGKQLPLDEIHEIFREQATALEERGVDLFILETFSELEEILAAIDAIRSFSKLPIVAQLTYSEEGSTVDGTRPEDAVAKMKTKDVQVIGANCTIGPQLLLPILGELATLTNNSSVRVSGMPNAGFPKRVGDRIVYPKSSPEYFAQFARDAASLGVRILGGCCGSTPEHVRAMVDAMKNFRPSRAAHVSPVAGAVEEILEPREKTRHLASREPESILWQKIQSGKFVVSVEIDPPKGTSIDRVLEQVKRVMASGKVDAIDINSGTLARVGMDALVLAGALEAHGVETVP